MVKKHIDFDTDKRKNYTSSFEKEFFKLMNKSAFGKIMEILINFRLVNNAKEYIRYISKPSFVSQKKFNKIFVAIHEVIPILTLDQPIYEGFSILDLSKLLIHEFHYKHIRKN